MANNPIYIKRSTGNGSPSSLSNGELAYSNTSQALFIGMGGSVYRIGGLQVPGTLTANQALVANATSGINNIITANLTISGYLTANGGLGNGQYLTANSTGGVYWSSPGAASVNTAAQYTWTNTHIFQANVSITGNSTAELLIATLGNAGALGGSVANQSGFYLGNSTVNSSWTYASLTLGTTTVGNASITEGTLGAAALVGGVQINTTSLALGNSTVNSTFGYNALTIGSSVVNSIAISTGTTVINATAVTEGTLGAASAVGGLTINTTALALGNSTVNGSIGYSTISIGALASNSTTVGVGANVYMDATRHFVGNATVNAVLTSTSLQFSGGNTVNNTVYTGQSSTVANGGVSVGSAGGLVSNSTGLFANAGAGIIVSSSGIAVNANTGIVANSTGTFVNPTLSITNLTLSGNLTVQGTTTTIDTTTLAVKDNMIILADQEASTGTFTDNIDTGFYVATGNTSVNYYAGIARIAASSTNTTPYFKLFSTTTLPNSTIIDTAATLGILNGYITGGGLVSNSTAINITANSTLSSTIAANSLTLSTQLGVASGGTGKNSLANNAVLIGNTAGAITELALGSSGYVLQSNGTTVVYDVVDGGLF